ncbi:hypothetical protein BST81_25085 [Leptolyngbya sp. 'hensonii']|uniref:glycosyltransferase family 39 protein n=1 Tax=Leptolyngbya sp. 'hensonii' TaxID=1922337 RepID=UPI00094FEB26|nr:glycosyltransferase family 39 protein [Leptolyngbya sp. 'hensonii']OLP15631.1 hypothetical protein BST81_25085 [Leptolyngbya sp. 'hensonii']
MKLYGVKGRDILVLVALWGVATIVDRVWFSLDQAPPAWDQGDHLTRAMNYWRVLQTPEIFSSTWWTQLWSLSPGYRAPFVYLATVPFLALCGKGHDSATLVNLLFTAILISSVYLMGRRLFDARTGLWAAALCLIAPSMALMRTDYLLDYGLTAIVAFTMMALTYWRLASSQLRSWLWSLTFGFGCGLTILARPNGLLFLVLPIAWVVLEDLFRRRWLRLLQLAGAFLLAWLIFGGWFTTNWLTILTALGRANTWGVLYQHDPARKGWLGWLYYGRILPNMVSPPIFCLALGCALLHLGSRFRQHRLGKILHPQAVSRRWVWSWLIFFCLGAYLFYSWTLNKEFRFILPYLPIVLLMLARSLAYASGPWMTRLRWGAAAIASAMTLTVLFPLPTLISVSEPHLPYLGDPYPNSEVIAAITQEQPYLRSTLGVAVNTSQINPMNMDFYGSLANFQVYGRQLGISEKTVKQDGRALNWYLTKTQNQGVYEGIEAGQVALKAEVEQNPKLQLQRTWSLPDSSQLHLYQRRHLPIQVEPSSRSATQVQLLQVEVPGTAPPGKPIPVTYKWSGPWADLRDGLVLLTWQQEGGGTSAWYHDHGIALGELMAGAEFPEANQEFQITEHLAMQPPASFPAGSYRLQAAYLNRRSGKTYPLVGPQVQVTLTAQATASPAPELDLVTQLRQLSTGLPAGKLDALFDEIGRINQYDPIQDYVIQAEQTLLYRLQQDPDRLDLLYNLVLTYILQYRAASATQMLTKITRLDAQNPYAWAYLGFIHLYQWQGRKAEVVLEQAYRLNPQLPELRTLRIVSAAMQLNLPLAWKRAQ